jgi:hypothetical protein
MDISHQYDALASSFGSRAATADGWVDAPHSRPAMIAFKISRWTPHLWNGKMKNR